MNSLLFGLIFTEVGIVFAAGALLAIAACKGLGGRLEKAPANGVRARRAIRRPA